MNRRTFLLGSTILLAGCSGQQTMSIQDILDALRKQCGFATTWQPIAQLIATMVSGFSPEAGAAATIGVAAAKQIIDMVCNTVRTQVAGAPLGVTGERPMTIIVNGVEIKGVHHS